MTKYVKYPPQGLLPLPGNTIEYDESCDVWEMIFDAALLVNPAFNRYRIFDTVSRPFLTPCDSSDDLFFDFCTSGRSYGTYWASRKILIPFSFTPSVIAGQGIVFPSPDHSLVLRPGGRQGGDPRTGQRRLGRVHRN